MNADLIKEFREAISSGLRSRTLTTCSRWAEYRRIMGEPFPGPYKFTYHPWCREISDSNAQFNSHESGTTGRNRSCN